MTTNLVIDPSAPHDRLEPIKLYRMGAEDMGANEAESSQSRTVEPREFRNALGHFATGVTVITARAPSGELVGVTANSFNSVSLDPPMVLWSLSKSSRGLAFFTAAECFCVNVLAADQVSLSNHFAGKKEEKFAEIDYELGLGGSPLLPGCAARFQCKTAFTYEGGDHLIFVGEVTALDETGKPGLVYHQGKYAVSNIHAFHAGESNPVISSGGFVDDYLDYLLSTAARQFQTQFQRVLDKTGRSADEWRVLAVLSDRPGISFDSVLKRSLIDASNLRALLKSMESDDLISSQAWGYEEEFFPTDRGRLVVLNLLAAAKAHEVDALGECSADEVQALKLILKKLIHSLDHST